MYNTGAELFGERQRAFNAAHQRPLDYIKPTRQPNL